MLIGYFENPFDGGDALLIRRINLVVRIRADVDKSSEELAENFDLFLRQRAPNASVGHIQSLVVLGFNFCIASTFAAGVALT